MIRLITHIAAVVFLAMAAFKATLWVDSISWLFLGLACWCASMLPLDGPLPARRRTE